MADFEHGVSINSILKTIEIGKYYLPSLEMFDNFVIAPKLDLFLIIRFCKHYKMTARTRDGILKIVNNLNSDTLWKEITKVIRGDLNNKDGSRNQDCELLYIFFSLQKYRLPQISIKPNSTEYLIAWSNRTISRIETELEDRILNPSEADKILKIFLDSKGFEWGECLYNELAIKYLMEMQPSPVGMMSNINHDYSLNSIGVDRSRTEMQIIIHRGDIRKIKEQKDEPSNRMRIMEFDIEIGKLNEKIAKLESNITPLDSDLTAYSSRNMECIRRLGVIFPEFYYLKEYHDRLSLLLHTECPDYFVALADKQREGINRRNLKRSNTETQSRLRQCQFCYEYRSEEISGNGSYSWHCDRDNCKKAYNAWRKHLKDSCSILLSKVFDVG
jgi:hypothetical protein